MNDVGFFVESDKIDIKIENGDLVADNGLETAVLISLFTDSRARTDELPQGQTKRRGWWGDLFPDVDGDKIGSKLWLLENDKQLLENLPKFENFAKESLNWLIEDGVASEVSVVATYPERGQILLEIKIVKPSGENQRFGFIWDGQEVKRG
jgi:phage gp46-like protein